MDRWQKALIYFGAFGTAWSLLRDLGFQVQAAFLLIAFFVGVLVGLRMHVLMAKRRSLDGAPKPSMPRMREPSHAARRVEEIDMQSRHKDSSSVAGVGAARPRRRV
jgi:hypothetical protein